MSLDVSTYEAALRDVRKVQVNNHGHICFRGSTNVDCRNAISADFHVTLTTKDMMCNHKCGEVVA